MKYSRGWLPNPPDAKVAAFHEVSKHFASSTPKGAADLRKFAPPPFDQGQTGSCTGHGTSCAIYTTLAAHGMTLPWVPSPKGIYDVGRRIDLTPSQRMSDDGANPNSVMRGITQWGVRPIRAVTVDEHGRFSDCSPDTINDDPTLEDLVLDERTKLLGEYALHPSTSVNDVCLALDNGIAVGVAYFVDTAFENWTPSDEPVGRPDFSDPDGGGHWVCILGYATDVRGKRVFRVRNSWGVTWGDFGDFFASEEWLKAAMQVEVIAVTVAPERKAAA